MANVLNGAIGETMPWWMKAERGVFGHDAGRLARSAAGTDAIDVLSTSGAMVTISSHDQQHGNPRVAAYFKISTPDHDLHSGDIVLVCDYTQASMLQLGRAGRGSATIEFRGGGVPGNCTKALGIPVVCSANGSAKSYGPNALLAKLHAARWFVDDNGRDGRSLYRVMMREGKESDREEVVDRVRDMQIRYLVAGASDYVDAADTLDWRNVVAVEITLIVQGSEPAGVGHAPLVRTVTHVVTLRNRLS